MPDQLTDQELEAAMSEHEAGIADVLEAFERAEIAYYGAVAGGTHTTTRAASNVTIPDSIER
jgi:hypothetical protein